MGKRFIILQAIFLVAALIFVLAGCDSNDYPSSLYDPNAKTSSPAVISAVEPASVALSGVTLITFTGSNFSTVKEDNIVYFNAEKGTVVEASATQLKVRAPIYVSDSIAIRIAVKNAEIFSNKWPYKLEAAQVNLLTFTPAEIPYGIATDATGNVYASLVVSNAGAGVKIVTPGAEKYVDYAPKGGETFWSAMKMGPGNVLYCARNLKGIFSIAAAATKPATFVSSGLGTIYDLDFDVNHNLWGVGNNTDIYRIKPDKSITKFPFTANLKSVRVYNGYLYVAGKKDGADKVWRFPFNGQDLGAVEEYFDFSAKVGGGYGVYCITFSADGYMYVGTDAPEAIFLVSPTGSYEPLYPGQFFPKTLLFAWGPGSNLYMTREQVLEGETIKYAQTIIRINTQKESAPYYGLQ
ncbi:MAG TPA: IPT/TIG domain-containing protein [bacterium]|nr:IPT/TIG domain-containing protein [bacterium]HPR87118.1 IPT/TIG domain-containing protein [bacterium]